MRNEGVQADEWSKRVPYEMQYVGTEGSGGHNPYPYPNYYGQMDDDEDYFSGYGKLRSKIIEIEF